MTFRPHSDNILCVFDVHRDARTETRSSGGIIIPHTALEPEPSAAVYATVIAAGPGAYQDEIRHDEGMPGAPAAKTSRKYIPMDPGIVPGARVLVDRYDSGDRYYVPGPDGPVEHRIIRMANVIGVAEEVAA